MTDIMALEGACRLIVDTDVKAPVAPGGASVGSKTLSDTLKVEVQDTIVELKKKTGGNKLVLAYRGKYGCKTKEGERLNFKSSKEMWAACDNFAQYNASDRALLEQLASEFESYWAAILQYRAEKQAASETLELASYC